MIHQSFNTVSYKKILEIKNELLEKEKKIYSLSRIYI